jgi:hypothetical protein
MFQDDIDRFRGVMKEMSKDLPEGAQLEDALYRGELEQLDDAQSERVVKEFFRR